MVLPPQNTLAAAEADGKKGGKKKADEEKGTKER